MVSAPCDPLGPIKLLPNAPIGPGAAVPAAVLGFCSRGGGAAAPARSIVADAAPAAPSAARCAPPRLARSTGTCEAAFAADAACCNAVPLAVTCGGTLAGAGGAGLPVTGKPLPDRESPEFLPVAALFVDLAPTSFDVGTALESPAVLDPRASCNTPAKVRLFSVVVPALAAAAAAPAPTPAPAAGPSAALSAAEQASAKAHPGVPSSTSKVTDRGPGATAPGGARSTDGSAAGASLANTPATSGGTIAAETVAQAPADGVAVIAGGAAAGGAATVAAAAAAATGPMGTTTGAPTAPQAAKAAGSESSFDSDAAVAASNVAGTGDARGSAALGAGAASTVAHKGAGSASELGAANLLAGVDTGKHAHGESDTSMSGGNSAEAAVLSQLGSNNAVSAPAAGAPAATLRIHASVEGADFPQGLSERVSWMVGNGVNGAKLQVNPPQLGPIELRISLQGDHAQVWMTTHSAVAREALEASSPKLHEMLGAQGFGQVSVDISQRSFQDRSAYTPPYQRPSTDRSDVAVPAVSAISSTPRATTSALDAYA